MATFQAQLNSPTGTLTIGSGTVNGQSPITVTEEEATYLRNNYSGLTVTEVKDKEAK